MSNMEAKSVSICSRNGCAKNFHNTDAAQEEYDSIFGNGAFMSLPVPNLAQRQGKAKFCRDRKARMSGKINS
jgi:hypothetical protein